MEQGVFAYFVVKTSKLVESYRAAKIRIIVTIFLTIMLSFWLRPCFQPNRAFCVLAVHTNEQESRMQQGH